MTAPRRMAVNGEKQRELLIDAAEALLLAEGSSALTARRVTTQCGMKSQLIYYYFQSMDDLVLEVLSRINARRQERFEAALQASDPLAALWDINSDPEGAILSSELIALAGHREAIRAAIIRSASEFRAHQVTAVEEILKDRAKEFGSHSAKAIVMTASALARAIVAEQALGMDDCHAEAVDMVKWLIALCGEKLQDT